MGTTGPVSWVSTASLALLATLPVLPLRRRPLIFFFPSAVAAAAAGGGTRYTSSMLLVSDSINRSPPASVTAPAAVPGLAAGGFGWKAQPRTWNAKHVGVKGSELAVVLSRWARPDLADKVDHTDKIRTRYTWPALRGLD